MMKKEKNCNLIKLIIIILLTLNTLKVIINFSITQGKYNYVIKKHFFYLPF